MFNCFPMNSRKPPQKALFTKQQKAVLALRESGLTAKQVAAILGISPYTVYEHQKKIGERLGVQTSRLGVLVSVSQAV